ncbi:DUF4260 domain-containing protein [Modestobacter sp. VKM Ac-2986]|uniref:DUF4260 domain-containing protein n=1 Tax=Modestobacter sp. VKM Ac-2986 TaxID=3004140 RepID=UPI0022AB3E3C|nr:DUF4260 domain-containing protein [Modestobacter sp. VKM Ac-2986]MCZ2827597.1 DUF4260 domain-containing protein [Modestobacter sp. VKM Ac-2986]
MTSTLSATPTAPAATAPTVTTAPGVVTGQPRVWLQAEGLALAVAALVVHGTTGTSWRLVPALFLVPDLAAFGHLAGDRVGAWTYDLAHTAPLPVALLVAGLAWDVTGLTVAGAVGLFHLGLDRALGYGVKYDSGSGHTHLGSKGPGHSRAQHR